MSKQTPMTPKDAARIQSHADGTGRNQDFKARAQQAAAANTPTTKSSNHPPKAPTKG